MDVIVLKLRAISRPLTQILSHLYRSPEYTDNGHENQISEFLVTVLQVTSELIAVNEESDEDVSWWSFLNHLEQMAHDVTAGTVKYEWKEGSNFSIAPEIQSTIHTPPVPRHASSGLVDSTVHKRVSKPWRTVLPHGASSEVQRTIPSQSMETTAATPLSTTFRGETTTKTIDTSRVSYSAARTVPAGASPATFAVSSHVGPAIRTLDTTPQRKSSTASPTRQHKVTMPKPQSAKGPASVKDLRKFAVTRALLAPPPLAPIITATPTSHHIMLSDTDSLRIVEALGDEFYGRVPRIVGLNTCLRLRDLVLASLAARPHEPLHLSVQNAFNAFISTGKSYDGIMAKLLSAVQATSSVLVSLTSGGATMLPRDLHDKPLPELPQHMPKQFCKAITAYNTGNVASLSIVQPGKGSASTWLHQIALLHLMGGLLESNT